MKYINSTVFALLSQVMPKFSATVLFILLARKTGQAEAGAYSLAVSILSIAILVSSFGFEEMLVREVARNRPHASPYFRSFLGLRLLINLVTWLLIILTVKVVFDYAPPVEATVLLMSLTLIPESITDLAQSLLVAIGQIWWTAVASTAVSISQFVAGVVVLSLVPGVQGLLIVLIVHSFVGCAVNLTLALSLSRRARGAEVIDTSERPLPRRFWMQQLRLTPAFIAINVLAVLDLQIGVLLLSAFRSIEEVGLFSAAKTLIASIVILAQALRIAVYPRLASLYPDQPEVLQKLYRRLFTYLAAASVPTAALLILTAPLVVTGLYKSAFSESSLPLQILAVSLIINFIYIPNSRLMMAAHRERQVAILLGVGFALNLVASLVLIPAFGVIGSAVARSLSMVVYFLLSELYVDRHFFKTGSFRSLATIGIPTVALVASFALLVGISPLLAVTAGAAVYIAVALLVRAVDTVHLRYVLKEYVAAFQRLCSRGIS